jgi:23S rRNA (adenine2503-C2)-methyltransferase
MDLLLLEDYLKSSNQPSFRVKQIRSSYFTGKFKSYDEMSDLPKSLRLDLQANLNYLSLSPIKTSTSTKTTKVLLKLADGNSIESVLMDYDDWLTVCLSSQVGCPLNCSFCATGKMGFKRNLTVEEILDQISYWQQQVFPKYIGRLVFMGMGEPFLNWDNLVSAIKIINSPDGFNIGARKISISTAGIVPGIYDFTALNLEINLAISLHSANQQSRENLMPIAKKYPLVDLKKALDLYTQKTKRQIFLEYALMKNINDTPGELNCLINFMRSNKLFYLNLIPLNPIKNGITPSDNSTLKAFSQKLSKSGINFSLRRTFGQNIDAACGQLVAN